MDQKKGEAAINKITKEFGKDRAMFIKTDVTKNTEMESNVLIATKNNILI